MSLGTSLCVAVIAIASGIIWLVTTPAAWPWPMPCIVVGAMLLGDTLYRLRCAVQDRRNGA